MQKRPYRFLEVFCLVHNLNFAMAILTENIKFSLDENRLWWGIFIDLQKAFDTVNHNILLRKLEYYGIRGKSFYWFKSYLGDRKHFVSVNDNSSFLCNITCGATQGSVLGPLLFLLCKNYLPKTSKLLKFFLFADDTNVYFESGDSANLTKTVEKELAQTGLESNKKEQMCFELLSVLVDEHLLWKHHTTEFCKKYSKTTGVFSKLRYLIS